MSIQYDYLYSPKWWKHTKKEKKYSNNKNKITKITLTISNAEYIKQTLSTKKPYLYEQHLPKISQKVSGAVRMSIRYERNTCIVRLLCLSF